MSELMIPHSGLSMKRIDRMVGIDGTAHGRMNSSDSHLIHVRACTKKPDRNKRDDHLQVDADDQEDERVDHRPRRRSDRRPA